MRSQYQNRQLPHKEDRSDTYPSVLLYGCGCWAAMILAGVAMWLAFGIHGW